MTPCPCGSVVEDKQRVYKTTGAEDQPGNAVVTVLSLGENNILQIMVKVVKGVRPDPGAVPRCRPPACAGFLSLMKRCWATDPNARPSFQGKMAFD